MQSVTLQGGIVMLDRKLDFYRIIEELAEGLYIVDLHRTILFWNKGAEQITGFTAKDVTGKSCADNILIHVDEKGTNLCFGICPLLKSINHDISLEADVYLHHKKGHRIPVSVRTSALKNDQGEIIGGVELFSDRSNLQVITERLKELEKIVMLDHLTQLANRRFLDLELSKVMEEHQRMRMPVGFFMIDVDNFKKINDTYGHDTGDEVLKLISAVLRHNSRPFDIFGRFGGEEFAGIIKNIDLDQLIVYGNRIRMLIEKSILNMKDQEILTTVSMGGTLLCDEDTPESLVKRADQLLYQSKQNGKNHLTVN